MGRKYSVRGYLNAALRRGGRTLLVEGPSDKAVLHRLIAERTPSLHEHPTIDHAGILEEDCLSGLGNKARVVAVQQSLDLLSVAVPNASEKLATLTDREWDGMNICGFAPDPEWLPPIQSENKFITLGHSIENYNFESECLKEYIRFHFAEYATDGLFSALDARVPALLVLAAVLSLKLRDESQLSRVGGMVDPSHLRWTNERYYLDDVFSSACAARSLICADTIVSSVNGGVDKVWNKLHGAHTTKWLPHGHIGTDVLWAGAGHVAYSFGFPANLVGELARGGKKQRELFQAQWLSKEVSSKREPLDATLDWLLRSM